MRKRLGSLGVGTAAVALALTGCGKSALPNNQAVQSKVALSNFNSCDELQHYIQDTAVLDMKSQLEQLKKGDIFRYGLAPGGGVLAAGPQAGTATPSAAPPSSFTTTNTQVKGVDEPDFVKNDGTRIFVLTGNMLYASLSWPASALATVGSLAIEGYPREMFLKGNQVVVFSSVYWTLPLDGSRPACAGGSGAEWMCAYDYANTTKVTTVDVSTLAAPKVTSEVYLPGNYADARLIQSSLRMVLEDSFRWPQDVKFWPDNGVSYQNDKAGWVAAIDQLEVQDEKVIRAEPLASWLPVGKRRLPDNTLVDVPYACTDFAKVNAPTKLGLMTVATMDVDHPDAPLARTSVLSDPGVVYASAGSLYLATFHWWWWPEAGQQDASYVHKFDLSQPDKVTYVASGVITGHVQNQFSLDEDDQGHLRVASTEATRVVDPLNANMEPWGHLNFTNRISVFGQNGNTLQLLGQTGEIAPGEAIRASRFMGSRGFIVTAKNVDPFFTFDLSDPAHPKAVGELQVAGISTYIQPVDANHLLTIGTISDAPAGNPQGWGGPQHLEVSLYDVTDFAHPKQTSNVVVGTGYSWSDALYDHKAFNYYPEKGLLAVPFSDWNGGMISNGEYWSSFVSDLRVFQVDVNHGLAPMGSLSMADVYQTDDDNHWTWYWTPAIQRSVMATDSAGANTYVYAISSAGIRVANLGSLGTPLQTAQFGIPRPALP